jgi:hypothetical protein
MYLLEIQFGEEKNASLEGQSIFHDSARIIFGTSKFRWRRKKLGCPWQSDAGVKRMGKKVTV